MVINTQSFALWGSSGAKRHNSKGETLCITVNFTDVKGLIIQDRLYYGTPQDSALMLLRMHIPVWGS